MVNFGGYLRAVKNEETTEEGIKIYFVPYNAVKELIFSALPKFESSWKEALEESCKDITEVMQSIWNEIFSVISDSPEESRGAPIGVALRAFVEMIKPEDGRETLQRMVQLHTAAAANAEALRKLIKKHDKYHSALALSGKLLPTLYSSSVFMSQSLLAESLGTLRELLNEEEARFVPIKRNDSDAIHLDMIESRIEELDWLKRLIASLPPSHISGLVAHRGFHHIKDRADKRPLENSLAAYELAWTSGIHLCECDIALTKDEKLVLAHDEDFKRLALHDSSTSASMKVSELTFRELISLPLKTGMRPPLLIDVLRSAHAISDNARLIIEIKPGNVAAASALARMLFRHPELCSCVAMIMSFDAITIHRLRIEFASAATLGAAALNSLPSRTSLSSPIRPLGHASHHRMLSMDHFGTFGNVLGPATPQHNGTSLKSGMPPRVPSMHRRHQSEASAGSATSLNNHFQLADDVGMSLSQTNLHYNAVHHVRQVTADESFSEPDIQLPKLMLLTVATPSTHPCEMYVSVNDLSPVDSWLARDDGSLDGVYLQFEQSMMTEEGANALQALSTRYLVGIWGFSGQDPDDYATFAWLKGKCNVTFVNSDLPSHFRKEIFKRR
ncbi:hypothetical protein MPSEU_000685100 [Mayamaea pseudoterrestris]|nr:hypothetical protein MPSEU_000685100 [Mayamaea pseudoterrestris]